MRSTRDLSVLWALRSPCNLGCDYCYFGTLEEHRDSPPAQPGALSHLPHGDLSLGEITTFLSTVSHSRIGRVFVAGGEPLIWPPIGEIIGALTAAGVEVIVCTNGIPLNRPIIRDMLLDLGELAVSVSLDSPDPELNDSHRRARNHTDGWHSVVSGIRALLSDRGGFPRPQIGIYTVLSRVTLDHLPNTARFAADLGVDYLVPQPISLEPSHRLHDELALRAADEPALTAALAAVYAARLPLQLPDPSYPTQVVSTLHHGLQLMQSCFGGHQLAFIEPDGSVWDCPSRHKIAATAAKGTQRSITAGTAAELFPRHRVTSSCDCPLYSNDCVNMWPLMTDFDRFLTPGRRTP